MTLIEALWDKGKGRIIDNGCDYELIALAKGVYTFHLNSFGREKDLEIRLDGKQGENAREIVRAFDRFVCDNRMGFDCVQKLDYRRL